ncbi:3-epi-6-deoxocathasterone 23-monooxygenase CYP90C1 [Macadamia integrifolia]|uniref:3-epi-6-deoxocathasterone 23-monooxygenase CYP90C1 n=1 Tax=Macadamia integrifolia TaxID=60698 RepID=UPI001C4EBA42|nr:3-epi-6-deoxocathasterone 23-monooxygenase CYP90C1 [Macadamia integrifolia]
MDLPVLGFSILLGIIVMGWWFSWKWITNKKKNNLEMEKKDVGGSRVPKGSLGWPFIGETLDFIISGYSSRPVSFMEKRKSLYGKVFKSHLLGRPIIVSTDPYVNKVVLQNNGSTFVPYYPKSVSELMGKDSILKMSGSMHKRVHGLLGSFLKSPQFKSRITRVIEKSVLLSMENWKDSNDPIYIQEETKKITFEVLVMVLMGIGPSEELEFLRREFREFIKGLICLPIKLPGTTFYKSLKAKDRMVKMVRRIVEEKKSNMGRTTRTTTTMSESERDDQRGRRPILDVVDMFLCEAVESNEMQQQQQQPVDVISERMIELMIPGEDSVPTLMTFAVKYLSDCPLALKQLTEENMELKRQKDSTGKEYDWTDYMSLPFTQDVINETLRMANIINAVWRKALKDVDINGYLIPRGWCVLASFTSIHFDDENYENSCQFDPWRWQKKEGILSSSNFFTPFGGGQRLCPGFEFSRLEVSIFLHHLVTRYRWVAEEDYSISFPTVKMKKKLPITVTPISS